jgi:hypothetical protein
MIKNFTHPRTMRHPALAPGPRPPAPNRQPLVQGYPSSMRNVEPLPGWLSTEIRPW